MKKLDYLKLKTIVKPLFLGENTARYYPGENAATFNWRKCRQRHFVPPAFSPDTFVLGNNGPETEMVMLIIVSILSYCRIDLGII